MCDSPGEEGVDPYNEAQNIRGGMRHFHSLLTRFHGNYLAAAAAYDAGAHGPGVAYFARTGNPRFLPAETKLYIDRIQRYDHAAGGTVTVDINHNNAPPGTSSSVTTSGSARLGSLRISRPDPEAMTALP